MPETRVSLQKDQGQPWGFRLQGGKDFASPLRVQKVNVGSVSEKAGLLAGDTILRIGNTDVFSLRHKEALDIIVKAGNGVQLTVDRGGEIWATQPKVMKECTPPPREDPDQIKQWQSKKKKEASEDDIAETIAAQLEVLQTGSLGINFKKFEKEIALRTDSPTYKLFNGEVPTRPAPRRVN